MIYLSRDHLKKSLLTGKLAAKDHFILAVIITSICVRKIRRLSTRQVLTNYFSCFTGNKFFEKTFFLLARKVSPLSAVTYIESNDGKYIAC